MELQLNQITELTAKERKKVLSWVTSLPEEEIIEIFQSGVKISYQLKDQYPDLSGKAVKFCAFILAARRSGWDTIKGKGYRVAGQEQFDDFSHLRKAKAAELINRGRKPVMKRKILAHWGEIMELRAEGMGLRTIAEFLRKKRKVKTSESYLRKLWKEVEKNA